MDSQCVNVSAEIPIFHIKRAPVRFGINAGQSRNGGPCLSHIIKQTKSGEDALAGRLDQET